ncbi:hypothetical protein GALMADRAFT_146779 [Galerina marginata CBS 339.88]|uniref:Uncharacterized protein n=1 Tax=Galerina marginata (strain CBS 339.88) TaxID=685588 RepID=A0A067SA69_GALM3|nr:hypothetical protein GALMADRAFT_146779 [Galerina marginata CBS 339.88]
MSSLTATHHYLLESQFTILASYSSLAAALSMRGASRHSQRHPPAPALTRRIPPSTIQSSSPSFILLLITAVLDPGSCSCSGPRSGFWQLGGHLKNDDCRKSTFVSSICGILLGTSTTCPIEWHLQPSSIWSACVSVAYFKSPLWSSKLSLDSSSNAVLGVASNPLELWYLVRKAELLAFAADQNPSTILALSEDDVDREYINILLSSSHSHGVIYVDLQCPGYISTQLTVVDLPGITQSGYSSTIKYIKALTRYYTMEDKKSIVALFSRSSERSGEVLALFKSFFQRRGKDLRLTMMIVAHIDAQVYIDPFWLNALSGSGNLPCCCLFFRVPDQHGPAALSSDMIKQIQQDEVAYFLFCKPWSAHPTKGTLGVVNILKKWDDQWNVHPVADISGGHVCSVCSWTIGLAIVLVLLLPVLLQH